MAVFANILAFFGKFGPFSRNKGLEVSGLEVSRSPPLRFSSDEAGIAGLETQLAVAA